MRYWWVFIGICYGICYGIELDCPNYSNTQNNGNIKWELTKNDLTPKNCSWTVWSNYQFQVPTRIQISNIHLTGSNSFTIWQINGLGRHGVQKFVFNSTNSKNIQFTLSPTTIEFDFSILANTKNDFFNISVTFLRFHPSFSTLPDSSYSPNALVVDSIDLIPWTVMQSASLGSLRIVIYDKENFNFEVLKKYYVLINSYFYQFAGTLYDVWMAGKSGSACQAQTLSILNVNIEAIDQFSLIMNTRNDYMTAYSLPPTSSQNLSSGTFQTVFQEITSRLQPVVFSQISVTGDGSVSIFAGCRADLHTYQNHLIARLDSSNFKYFENLSVYGRCLTYYVTKAEVHWKKTQGGKNSLDAHIGVAMSYQFPADEISSYSYTNSISNPGNGKTFRVTYEKSEGASVIVEADGVETLLTWNSPTTISGTGSQIVKANLTSGQQGFLVRYRVNSSEKFSMLILLISFICYQ